MRISDNMAHWTTSRAQFNSLKGPNHSEIYCAGCRQQKLPVRFAYRCFDCGCWYCEACMGKHLGRERMEPRGSMSGVDDAENQLS